MVRDHFDFPTISNRTEMLYSIAVKKLNRIHFFHEHSEFSIARNGLVSSASRVQAKSNKTRNGRRNAAEVRCETNEVCSVGAEMSSKHREDKHQMAHIRQGRTPPRLQTVCFRSRCGTRINLVPAGRLPDRLLTRENLRIEEGLGKSSRNKKMGMTREIWKNSTSEKEPCISSSAW